MLLDAFVFGFAVVFLIIGLVGIIVPILPGIVLIWLTVLAYAIVERFEAIDPITFFVISLIALISGTSDLWMTFLGAKTSGASVRAMVLGFLGGILGFFLLGSFIPIIGSLVGGIFGYSIGVLIGQYHKYRDWNLAFKASVGGVVGWGVATIIQVVAGIIIIMIFIWQVLSYSG